jgi:hypothetical protein
MREVSSVMWNYIRLMMERAGIHTAPHLEGSSLAHVRPSPWRRVDWYEVATFMNRCETVMSEELKDTFGEHFVAENTLMQATARVIMPPRIFHKLCARICQHSYNHMKVGVEDLPDGRVRWTIQQPRT